MSRVKVTPSDGYAYAADDMVSIGLVMGLTRPWELASQLLSEASYAKFLQQRVLRWEMEKGEDKRADYELMAKLMNEDVALSSRQYGSAPFTVGTDSVPGREGNE